MNEGTDRTPITRDFFDRPVLEAAPGLEGRILVRSGDEGLIGLWLTGVEAYAGPGSHTVRGLTARNGVMPGPPGHSYVHSRHGLSGQSA